MCDIMISVMQEWDDAAKLIRVPIGFPAEMHAWLRETAFRRHIAMAELVREAVQEFRDRHEPQLPLPIDKAPGS